MSNPDSPRPTTLAITPSVPAPLALRLRVIDGADFGKELATATGTYLVGKEETCDLVLTDPTVSRTHLQVEVRQGRLRLKDLGSRNGSTCDGVRFDTVDADCGAEIRVGHTTLKILAPEDLLSALEPSQKTELHGLVGKSLVMRSLFAELERLATKEVDALLLGETGTGKELCARALHAMSPRASGPFVTCDLGSVSPDLFESELFGHVPGAFTHAKAQRKGAAVLAHGGTLFLDEVAELPLALQPRLLRLLDQREVKPVGGDVPLKVDIRVIAATHRDLAEEVRAQRLREDLYHRLAVVTVKLPPLRERREDLPMLVEHLLRQNDSDASLIEPATMSLLRDYPWPGNVRELRNVIVRVVSLGVGSIGIDPPRVRETKALANSATSFHEAKERLVQSFERDFLTRLLETCDGNVKKAAELSELDRTHLYALLKRHAIDPAVVRKRKK
jgi:two-component system, NtrC family, nitrogen regulation response regulator GlnG